MEDHSSRSAGLYWAEQRTSSIDQVLGYDPQVLEDPNLLARFIDRYPETARQLVSFAGLRDA